MENIINNIEEMDNVQYETEREELLDQLNSYDTMDEDEVPEDIQEAEERMKRDPVGLLVLGGIAAGVGLTLGVKKLAGIVKNKVDARKAAKSDSEESEEKPVEFVDAEEVEPEEVPHPELSAAANDLCKGRNSRRKNSRKRRR